MGRRHGLMMVVLGAVLALGPMRAFGQGGGTADAVPPLTFVSARLVAQRDSFVATSPTGTAGWMRGTLTQTPAGGWRYVEEADVSGVLEYLALTRLSSALRMVQAQQSGEALGLDVALDLSYAAGRVRGVATVLGAGGARLAAIDTMLAPEVLDLNIVSVLLRAVPWGASTEGRIDAFSPLAGGRVSLVCRVVEQVVIDVPAGRFTAWQVRVSSTGSSTDYWITTEAPYRIVRVQSAGVPFAFLLAR